MKKKKILIAVLLLAIASASALYITSNSTNNSLESSQKIRIGWMVSWATQGQLAQVLQKTNILEENGITPQFATFSYGGPLSEAALAGKIDAGFLGDVPAIVLLSKSEDWVIVAKFMTGRTAIIVPKNSSIEKIEDLKGKVVSVPFNSGPHLKLIKAFKEKSMVAGKDFELVNLDILEQSSVIQAGSLESWGKISAFGSFDPTIAIFEQSGKAREIEDYAVVGVVVMSKNFIKKNPEVAKQFLKSLKEAYYYYSQNQKQANEWYAKEARISFDASVLDIINSLEPNLKASAVEDINFSFSPEDIKTLEETAQTALEERIIAKKPNLKEKILTEIVP